MFAVIALTLAAAPSQSAPVRRCTAATLATCAAGSWTGALGGAEWLFEIKRENGTWTGRYRTTKGKSWQPLLALAVADGTISFGIVSTPRLSFRLAIDPATDRLGGQAEIEGLAVIPFTATRTA